MNNLSTLLVVKDLSTSISFFVNILDFIISEQYPDCVKLNYGQQSIIIFQGTKEAIEYDHGYSSNSTLLITVSNLDAKIADLKSKGVSFVHDTPNENRWGRYMAFKDPSGIIHELFELYTS